MPVGNAVNALVTGVRHANRRLRDLGEPVVVRRPEDRGASTRNAPSRRPGPRCACSRRRGRTTTTRSSSNSMSSRAAAAGAPRPARTTSRTSGGRSASSTPNPRDNPSPDERLVELSFTSIGRTARVRAAGQHRAAGADRRAGRRGHRQPRHRRPAVQHPLRADRAQRAEGPGLRRREPDGGRRRAGLGAPAGDARHPHRRGGGATARGRCRSDPAPGDALRRPLDPPVGGTSGPRDRRSARHRTSPAGSGAATRPARSRTCCGPAGTT